MRKLRKQNIEEILALTPMQEGMLFHYLKDSNSNLYFEQLSLDISGEIVIEIFEKAWNFVVETNEMLRTVFRWEKVEDPIQIILKKHHLQPGYYDLSGKESSEKEKQVEKIKSGDRKRGFDLREVPFRVTLCKLETARYLMIISNFHILYDGWSNGIILKEFFKTYDDLSEGKPLVRHMKTKFKEFIQWIQNQDLGQQEKYWKNYLKGFNTQTGFSVMSTQRGKEIKSPGKHQTRFEKDISDKIDHFVKKYRITLASLLYTAWGLLLHQYNYTNDVMLGTTVSGRNANVKGIESIVGVFINTIPLRVQTHSREKIEHLLYRIDQALHLREEHEHFPLVSIKESSEINNQEELFDTIVIIENYPLDRGLSITNNQLCVESYSMAAKTHYDLTVGITIFDYIELDFIYNKDLFEEETISRLCDHFKCTVEDIITNPGKEVSHVRLMSEQEKDKLLYEFNRNEWECPKEKTLYQLFEEQADKTPDNIVVIGMGQSGICTVKSGKGRQAPGAPRSAITYGELNERAHRLAFFLRGKGVGPDSIISLLGELSLEIILGIMAVLKAGGAYLPIDPDYPEDRIHYMLSDSGTTVLLAAPGTRVKVKTGVEEGGGQPQELPLQFINLREAPSTLPSTCQVSPANLAYVIYTSGTTGQPKGVLIKHQSAVNTLLFRKEAYKMNENDVALQLFSYSFDGFVTSFFTPVISGSRVILLTGNEVKDIDSTTEAIAKFKVTHFICIPPLYRLIIENLSETAASRLKIITLAGDQVLPNLMALTKQKNRDIEIAHEYGVTEAAVMSTICRHQEKIGRITIGKPIGNTRIYVMNRFLGLQPLGAAGELCISGVGLARGYLNKPGLTAERFCPRRPGGTFYRTGDLARWLPDGYIEFLGRIDSQVKIRGFRIELGEIEKQLLNHEDIKEAVVTIKIDRDNENYLCGYVVMEKELTGTKVSDLKAYLSKKLPYYMVPTYLIQLHRLPLTRTGKVDRKVLPEPGTDRSQIKETYVAPQTNVEKMIAEAWKRVLKIDKVGVHDNFFDLGGNSLSIIRLNGKLKEIFKRDIKVVTLFNYPTVGTQGKYFGGEVVARPVEPPGQAAGMDIAVIGMAGRFPGASNIHEFWDHLKDGVESITFFTDEELETMGVAPGLLKNPHYVKAKGILEDIEYFDPDFFDYTAREAEMMDPQMRIMHECAWEALEDAGYDPFSYRGGIGFYAGAYPGSWMRQLSHEITSHSEQLAVSSLNQIDYLGTRVSYKLNLKGPALTVQTACSTSLVAIDSACQALWSGKCHMALAGGITITFEDRTGYLYEEGMVRSPDGHCRPFDTRASGTIGGNGVGMVVLKPLTAAISDTDYIRAVIKGTATNNDGTRKVGFTAPSVEGQAEVIRAALDMAAVAPETITYVETHGTGTPLGDPVEIEALKQAFNTEKKAFCPIGAVKGNIGHLDAAAGAAGLIKTVLALQHRMIPPAVNFESPNPEIDFENSPFYVNNKLTQWENKDHPLRAGVSSFGIGGTNAHILLEEAPKMETSSKGRHHKLILLSAKTKSALERNTFNLVLHMKKNPGMNLADAAYTLQVGRGSFKHRRMVVGETAGEIIKTLEKPVGNPLVSTSECEEKNKRVIFMFPGQGSQYVDMGLGLYKTEAVFREEMNRCFEILTGLADYNIKEILYPQSDCRGGSPGQDNRPNQINRTEIAQPLIFIFEYALAKLLMSWGIKPRAMIGHSIGEYTAACLAGVFSLEDALQLVAWRGKLMQQMPGGAMLGVPLTREEVEILLTSHNQLSLAAVNSSSLCVVSGPCDAVEDFARLLEEREEPVTVTRLHTSHAFHSYMMDPMLKAFEEKAGAINLKPPQLPYISNLTGQWITVEKATEPSYWAQHVRKPVQYNQGLNLLLKEPKTVLVEIGPGRALSTFVKKHHSFGNHQTVLNLVRHPRDKVDDSYFLLQRLGHLWLSGVSVDWQGFYQDEQRHRLTLPTYSFDRKYYWKYGLMLQAQHTGNKRLEEEMKKKETGKKNLLKNWFYVPTWKHSQKVPPYHPSEIAAHSWLIFMDSSGWGEGLISRIKQHGGHVFLVKQGSKFVKMPDDVYSLNSHNPKDYENLLKSLTAEKKAPPRIVHLWNVLGDEGSTASSRDLTRDGLDRFLGLGFYSLIYLAQAVGKLGITDELLVTMVTDKMQTVTGSEVTPGAVNPIRSTLLGACKVIPGEYPNLHCKSIDIVLPPPGSQRERRLLDQLLGEFIKREEEGHSLESAAAYRGGIRWVRDFEPVFLDPPRETAQRLKPQGVYLVTGGLGGMGLVLSQYLAAKVRARLILTDLCPFPVPAEYDQWLADHGEQDTISQQIRELKKMTALGAEVTVAQADAADYSRMKAVIKDAVQRYGSINGILHTAGVPDGGVIQAKTREAMEAVMAPKIKGTLVLDALLSEMAGDFTPDFFILCSSLSAVLGTYGQVAYTAANVFLDYFARYKNSRTGKPGTWMVSINWDAWREVGMAVKAESKFQGREVAHPLFQRCVKKNTHETVFTSTFGVKDRWVLDEHRLMGKAVLPGTAYLEMARAAFEHLTGNTAVEIRETYFLAPLVMEENEEREVRTILKKQEDNGRKKFSFSIVSRLSVSTSYTSQWHEHARGRMIPLNSMESHEVPKYAPGQLMDECREDDAAIIDISHFGPRWSNIKKVRYGKGYRVAVLELDAAFAPEVSTYKLHPALLDMAVSFLDERIKQGNRYIPFSYNGIKMYRPLPHRLLTRVRLHENPSLSNEMLEFEVRIMDEEGSTCVEIESFMLKQVKGEVSAVQSPLGDRTRNLCLEMPAAAAGNLEALELKPGPVKKPGPGEVEIEVFASGLNFKEVLFALGMLPPPGQILSFGLECSGRICGLGEGVTDFRVGDEVIAFASPAFSRFVLTPARAVAHKPGHLNFVEAATIPIAFLTAYYSLITLGRLQGEERVLIHSAAGGVGLAAVKIARWKGAEIFATAGNPEKREYLSSLGIKHVMDSRSLDFADKVKTVTGGKGVDVLLNSLAGEFIPKGLSIMAPYGRFLEIGVKDIFNNSQLGMRAFERGISFFAVSAGRDIPGFTTIFREVAAHMEKRNFGPLPYRGFPMDNAVDAFKYMSQAKHIGKIVITHPDRLEQYAGEGLPAEELPSKGILPVEGIEVVDRILDQVPVSPEQHFSQVVVSTTDLFARMRKGYHTRMPGGVGLEVAGNFETKGAVTPRPPLSTDYVPPGTEMEKQVVRIWQDFLGLEKVGIHDNFFELGASSLDIIQVNNKLNGLLGKELSVVNFYSYPTVRSLVESFEGNPSTEELSSGESQYGKSKKTFKNTIKKMKRL